MSAEVKSLCDSFVDNLKNPGSPVRLFRDVNNVGSRSVAGELVKSAVAWQFFTGCVIALLLIIFSIVWGYGVGIGNAIIMFLWGLFWTFVVFVIVEKGVKIFVLLYLIVQTIYAVYLFIMACILFGVAIHFHIPMLVVAILEILLSFIAGLVAWYAYKLWSVTEEDQPLTGA